MIKSFKHKGVKRFYETESKVGKPDHASKLVRQLAILDRATNPEDMNIPGWRLHPLVGDLSPHWAITVSGNWRLTFAFEDGDVVLVDYKDYH